MEIDGKKVINASKPVLIKITTEDCKTGRTKKPDMCAAALACQRDLKCIQARVHISTTYVETNKHWLRYRTPGGLRDEIISFDRGTGFHPGEFILRPLQPSHQANGARQGGPNKPTKKRSSSQRAPYHVTNGVRPSPRQSV